MALDQPHLHLSSPHRAAVFARALLSNPHTSTSTHDATLSTLATAISISTSTSSSLQSLLAAHNPDVVTGAHLDEDLTLLLDSLASDLYPSVRGTALGGLAAVLEKAEPADSSWANRLKSILQSQGYSISRYDCSLR